METFQNFRFCALLVFVLVLRDAFSTGSGFSYACVGTSTCVRKFMSQVWKEDSDFFPLDVTENDFSSNCSQAQTCLNDVTGGGGSTEVSDVTTAAVSFIYDVCSKDRQRQFGATLQRCILIDGIRLKAEMLHVNWINDRDANLAVIANQNQVKKFCALLNTYLTNLQSLLEVGGCIDVTSLNWCMKIVRENVYERYGAYCPCYGNCDCKYVKSSSPVNQGNGSGAAYMMVVFGIFFLIGAVLVKKSGRRR